MEGDGISLEVVEIGDDEMRLLKQFKLSIFQYVFDFPFSFSKNPENRIGIIYDN